MLEGLPISILTIALGLSLWVAVGCFVHALAGRAGDGPPSRLAVGAVIVLIVTAAVAGRRVVAASLRRRPWLMVPIAAGQLILVAADGFVGSPYVAWTLTSVGLAVVAARDAIVWACVVVLCVGYTFGVLLEYDPGALVENGHLDEFAGAFAAYPLTALVMLALRRRFVRFVARAPELIDDIRTGPVGGPVALLNTTDVVLTPAEQRVVDGLIEGMAPKEMARAWNLSVATIRTHIAHAKRKAGARTMPELVALAATARSRARQP